MMAPFFNFLPVYPLRPCRAIASRVMRDRVPTRFTEEEVNQFLAPSQNPHPLLMGPTTRRPL